METPEPIPATPKRLLTESDKPNEVRVLDITSQFKSHGIFTFEGSSTWDFHGYFASQGLAPQRPPVVRLVTAI